MRVSSRVFQAPVPIGGTGGLEVHTVDRQHERVALGAHQHADFELLYFERGGGQHVLDTTTYEIRAGDLYLVPPGQVHDLSTLAAEANGWAIEFSAAALHGAGAAGESTELWRANPLLQQFLRDEHDPASARLRVKRAEQARWTARCRDMQREYHATSQGRSLALSAYLTLTMIDVARLAEQQLPTLRPHHDPVMSQVFAVINECWAEGIGATDIADRIGLTPGYLTTLVRRRTGRTLSAWLAERRMSEARALLLRTNRSVESIAAEVGFTNPAHFTRRFSQLHGAPPGQWRRTGP